MLGQRPSKRAYIFINVIDIILYILMKLFWDDVNLDGVVTADV